ncbi:MAG: hypothetical protein OXI80_20720 [Caldilineaceae bacterium]|uniref:Uncharacterized protein n=1 Tax=Caldilineaceae bacterium SB0664_bin_27 TaxID=2605260 RepID=A0A6B0YVY8_9CHLR|nr:hypothetical protein [Caldilineaceae bacterium]MDE0340108.1 hypothetical protein [Caldilineaceae bacterium]MXY94295.1 hypothetical protein [Caldilineaceae bacterium SB0664_bin_27]
MHTSQQLRSSHFEYRRPGAGGRVAFSAFCADYHDQDRVGVVSPRLEDGVLHTAYALLAITTSFYDVQRASGSDFFIYPQHLAIIGQDSSGNSGKRTETGIATGAGSLDLSLDEAGIGGAWAWLDVWPASNWHTAPQTPTAMLKKVFDLHINRLFWPQDFLPERRKEGDTENEDSPLPDYARRILSTRLKSVYYYNTSAPTVEISAAQPAVDIVQYSLERLPEAVRQTLEKEAQPAHPLGYESYRQVSGEDFLGDMETCFIA